MIRQPRDCALTTPDLILALCLAREIERNFGRGGHTTRATQDAAVAALNARKEPPNEQANA